MVLREQRINGMELEGFLNVDSWKTYAFQSPTGACTDKLLILKRGRGKVRYCMSSFYDFVQGYS